MSTYILYRRTKSIPSKQVITEIHSLIDDIVKQSNLLEQNIVFLQLNVNLLNDEVEQLKHRNTSLATQIVEIGDAVKAALQK